ncbi:MAG: hypothetical protein ABL993_11895 [Vicinamibacterales bacterium]
MRDIRARIATSHGIDLTSQQIQELAARRLEAILDPRTMKPGLLDQLRKGAGVPRQAEPDSPRRAAPYTFDETSLYESHRGLLRFIRSLLKPVLKLFLNPAPLVTALKTQVTLNAEAAAREDDNDRRQAEWNALHYEVLQRVVTETARVSIELQSLSMHVESLSGKVDFNDRRVRAMEGASPLQSRAALRQVEPYAAAPPRHQVVASDVAEVPRSAADDRPAPEDVRMPDELQAGDAVRPADGRPRRRRRRRGRRSATPLGETPPTSTAGVPDSVSLAGGRESEDADEDTEAPMSANEVAWGTAETPAVSTVALTDATPTPQYEESEPRTPSVPAAVPEAGDRSEPGATEG